VIVRSILLAAAAALVVIATGCGARNNNPYTAKGTAACMTKKGFAAVTTNPIKIGLIAGFADNGGLRATTSTGNILTIAFTADENGVASTKRAFRTHAPARLRSRMNDIMESQRNAVLVWTVSPTPTQLADALGCLAS
jgi:hypothetical protein